MGGEKRPRVPVTINVAVRVTFYTRPPALNVKSTLKSTPVPGWNRHLTMATLTKHQHGGKQTA